MPIEIPDLWGDDFQVEVLSPILILRMQAEAIQKKTRGILLGEVSTRIAEPDETQLGYAIDIHNLDLIAPAINYRESILEVWHKVDRYYPIFIKLPEEIEWEKPSIKSSSSKRASSEEEYIHYLGVALQSSPSRSVISTLLAKSNDLKLQGTSPKPKSEV
jgi:hypothetical protein